MYMYTGTCGITKEFLSVHHVAQVSYGKLPIKFTKSVQIINGDYIIFVFFLTTIPILRNMFTLC